MKSAPVPAALFIKNRNKLASLVRPGSLVIIGSAEKAQRNGDQFYPYRQESNFFYLTGINQAESVFVFFPGHDDPHLREILFIRKSTGTSDLWTGPLLTFNEATVLSGISHVAWLEELDDISGRLIREASVIYSDKPPAMIDFTTLPLSSMMIRLRMVKEVEEIAEMRKAAAITGSAFLRVLDMIKPGVWEYQVEAEIIGEFIGQGAEGHAYDPIVAAGNNALVLHYTSNNCQCRAGELLLLDFGTEVNNYAVDCTRVIPVSGRFSVRQREIYNAVHRIFRQARDMMVPGTSLKEYNNNVSELWEEEHIRLGLYTLKEAREHTSRDPLWKRYLMHGTSHSLGLDVHDPIDRLHPFEPGMVLTCEPAIYIHEEKTGIRLEDDILIGEEGPVDLLEHIPMEAEEIEALILSKR